MIWQLAQKSHHFRGTLDSLLSTLYSLMHVGTLTVVLHLAEGSSLKDKRQVIKSLVETTRQKFNVAIAEVDDLDVWRRATLGVAAVSNDAAHTNRVLDKVLYYLESNPAVSVAEVSLEML